MGFFFVFYKTAADYATKGNHPKVVELFSKQIAEKNQVIVQTLQKSMTEVEKLREENKSLLQRIRELEEENQDLKEKLREKNTPKDIISDLAEKLTS